MSDPNPQQILLRWSALDQEATKAERLVAEKLVAHALGKGPAATPEEIVEAKRLRNTAVSLLALLMDDLQRQQTEMRNGPNSGSGDMHEQLPLGPTVVSPGNRLSSPTTPSPRQTR